MRPRNPANQCLLRLPHHALSGVAKTYTLNRLHGGGAVAAFVRFLTYAKPKKATTDSIQVKRKALQENNGELLE